MTADSANEAVSNGRAVKTYDQGMCQKYVRGPCWEVGSLYGSAIEAWNGAKLKHPGDRSPPKGAPLYYRGGQYGHAVLGVGGSTMRSTDCHSSGYVNDEAISWPENHWGYVYLGWTGDINGVTLPLGSGGGSGSTDEGGLDDVGLQDEITEWSPDEGSTGDTTVGKTLNQARGYAEDAFERVKKVQNRLGELDDKLDKILAKLS